jgi:NAD(P)-dependent dehydrogenase (short-subunit alcohol dehydrogenase family)
MAEAKMLQVQKVYAGIVEDFGEINVQVSCAGIAGYTPAVEHMPETWHKVLNVNLHGTFWTAQAAGRLVVVHYGACYKQRKLIYTTDK